MKRGDVVNLAPDSGHLQVATLDAVTRLIENSASPPEPAPNRRRIFALVESCRLLPGKFETAYRQGVDDGVDGFNTCDGGFDQLDRINHAAFQQVHYLHRSHVA